MTIVTRIDVAPVRSSMIRAVGFDPESQVMEVLFCNGHARQYFGVPVEVYNGLRSAPSPGRYFMKHVRHVYEYRSVGRSSI